MAHLWLVWGRAFVTTWLRRTRKSWGITLAAYVLGACALYMPVLQKYREARRLSLLVGGSLSLSESLRQRVFHLIWAPFDGYVGAHAGLLLVGLLVGVAMVLGSALLATTIEALYRSALKFTTPALAEELRIPFRWEAFSVLALSIGAATVMVVAHQLPTSWGETGRAISVITLVALAVCGYCALAIHFFGTGFDPNERLGTKILLITSHPHYRLTTVLDLLEFSCAVWIGMVAMTHWAVPYTRDIPFLEERRARAVFQAANTPNLQLDLLRHIHTAADLSPAQRAVREGYMQEEIAAIGRTFSDNIQAIRSSTDRLNRAVASISGMMIRVATLALALLYLTLTFYPWALAKVIAFGRRPWRWHLSKGASFQVASVVPTLLATYFVSQTTVSSSELFLWLILAIATTAAGAHLNASTAAGSPVVFVSAKGGAAYHSRQDCPSIGRRAATPINRSSLVGLPFTPCKRCSLTDSDDSTTDSAE